MKRLNELFSFSFMISALINRGCRVNWMGYIAGIFFLLYAFSTVFLIYSHKQETGSYKQALYLQPIITQYFIDNKSEIWLLFLIAHSKR